MPRWLLRLSLPALLAPALAAQLGAPTLADVAYGPYADPDKPSSAERLDLYAHGEATAPQPVLIEIHPGGFVAGSKSDFDLYLGDPDGLDAIDKAFAAGFAVVSLDYPLAEPPLLPGGQPNPEFPKHRFPRAAHSVRRAIQFVRSRAGEWNLDPGRVFLIGTSAGGNLGLWAAMTRDAVKPKSKDPVKSQSSRPNGMVFLSTPVRLDPAHLLLAPDDSGLGGILGYFGKQDQAALAQGPAVKKARAASPGWRATHAKGGTKLNGALGALNASLPLLGVYADLDAGATSADYELPVDDPHSAVFGLLMREALDEWALQSGDPQAQWGDFTLLGIEGHPAGPAVTADAVVAWLEQRAGLP